MIKARHFIVTVILAILLGSNAVGAQLLGMPVQQVPADNLPMKYECEDDEYALVALVHNTSLASRDIGVEAVFVAQDGTIVHTVSPYAFHVEVAAGERAMLADCVPLAEAAFVGTVRLRAIPSSFRSDRPLLLPFWFAVDEPMVETWQADGGYHQRARASFLARNGRRRDAWVAGQIRFYNVQGHQVAICGFRGRALAGTATRLECVVHAVDLIPDVPVRSKVEVLRLE